MDDRSTVHNFFESLYGAADDGYLMLCHFVQKPGGNQSTVKALPIPVNNLDAAVEYVQNMRDKHDVYFGLGLQRNIPGSNKRGDVAGVCAIPGLWMDLDIKGPGHKAENLPATVDDALLLIAESLPLQPSIVISTGGGLHCYWLFREPWVFDNEAERNTAASMSKRFQQVFIQKALEKGWVLDNTASLAQVLRPVGTLNHKPIIKGYGTEPLEVGVLSVNDSRYNPDEIEQYLPCEYNSAAHFEDKQYSSSYPLADITRIFDGCSWLRHCRDDAKTLPEPEWYYMLSVVSRCENGQALAHGLSDPYPGYTVDETDRKLNHALQYGCVLCSTVKSKFGLHCQGCDLKVNSPISIGRNVTDGAACGWDGSTDSQDASEEIITEPSYEKKDKKTVSQFLLELSTEDIFFQTEEGIPYCSLLVGDHRESHKVSSKGHRLLLSKRYYEATGKAPGSQSMQDALEVLSGRSMFEGKISPVYTRIAPGCDNSVYVDLGNEKREAIHITKSGWKVISQPPVYFVRPQGLLPLPYPEAGGNLIDELSKYVNLEDDSKNDSSDSKNNLLSFPKQPQQGDHDSNDGNDGNLEFYSKKNSNIKWVNLIMYLIGTLNPNGPYPILSVNGEQGSAKSTLCKIIAKIVDPRRAGLRAMPTKIQDLIIAAQNGHLIAFDNVSGLNQEISDALCRISTGGGWATRAHYSNDEEMLFDVCKPQILNGITQYVTADDLRDRILPVQLARIEVYKRESDIWGEFEKSCPLILGSLLDCVVLSIRNKNKINTTGYRLRMADFAQWAAAGAEAIGISSQECLETYSASRKLSVEAALNENPFAQAIVKIAQEGDWKGTATELLGLTKRGIPEEILKSKTWPKTPAKVGNDIRRLLPALREVGVLVDPDSRTGSKRVIRIELEYETKKPSLLSLPSQRRDSGRLTSDGRMTVVTVDNEADEVAATKEVGVFKL